MRHGERGVSLVEVMVVVAVLAIATAIVGASLHTNQVRKNERMAIRTLRQIADAQEEFRSLAAIDVNQNRRGEYGYFGDLSGHSVLRAGTQTLVPPLLSAAFGSVSPQSNVVRTGYLFRIYLPIATAYGVAETPVTGGDPANALGVDPGRAEELWCCYAWPLVYGSTGKRTFFVNQDGDVLATSVNAAVQYGGILTPPAQSAAFLWTSTASMADNVAANTLGVDGNRWSLVH